MKKNPAQEIVEAVQILIDNSIKNTTNINGGIITAINDDNRYSVQVKGKTNNLPIYPKNAYVVPGDTVLVFVPQGENSQGFIMPNSFNNLNSDLFIIDKRIDSTTTSISNIYGHGVFINDVNNKNIGWIRAVSLDTGENGIEFSTTRKINGATYNNTVGLFIDESGNQSVKISNPDAWKTALEI